ncbi:MAG: ABC transporter ATPase [Flavobacteriaceae bacterium]|nr:ABC transporter ATPase [Flavobacteriaceae bacterium]MDG1961935.1 ABC transporter ATPase [Flavobacteriaceae bacterium]
MLRPFSELPDHSRVWIYQSNRKFSDQEVILIKNQVDLFLSNWTAHGADLEAGAEVRYNRFIVLGLNQENASASGCSIDASVRFVQELQEQLGVDLLDKMNVTFYSGAYIAHKTLLEFRKMAKNKSVSKDTIVFNNLVNTKKDYIEHWEVPAFESWHNRFLS